MARVIIRIVIVVKTMVASSKLLTHLNKMAIHIDILPTDVHAQSLIPMLEQRIIHIAIVARITEVVNR
jgi:hypothetical protein